LSFDIYKVKISYLFIFLFFVFFEFFSIKSRAGFSAPVGSFSSFSAPAKQEITKFNFRRILIFKPSVLFNMLLFQSMF